MDKETGPATEATSAEAARLFGEGAAGNYVVVGRLLRVNRLPVGDLGLLTVGFRFTDRPYEKWTRRFNRFKYGEPTAATAATRTFCAAFEGFHPTGNPRVVVVSSVSSEQHDCGVRHAGVETGVRACTIPRLGVAPGGHITKYPHPRISGIASAAERDATVDGVYLATPIGGVPGLVLVVDDFCTRGATLADIARAIRESNPGWKIQAASLAKTERAAYWRGELTNAHIPDVLDATSGAGPRRSRLPGIETQQGLHTRPAPPAVHSANAKGAHIWMCQLMFPSRRSGLGRSPFRSVSASCRYSSASSSIPSASRSRLRRRANGGANALHDSQTLPTSRPFFRCSM